MENLALEPVEKPGTVTNSYEDDVKKEAVRQAVEEGKSMRAVAMELGIQAETLSAWIREIEQEEGLEAKALDIGFIRTLGNKIQELQRGITKTKINKAGLRDIAIALGILLDKRRDLLGPSAGPSSLNLRVAWKDGSGAVELSTNQVQK